MATAFRLLTRVQDASDFPPSVTAGSVLYGGGAGVAQDNAGLYYDGTNHNLGVGVSGSNVKARLHAYIGSGFQSYVNLSGGTIIPGHILTAVSTDATTTGVMGVLVDTAYNPASAPGSKIVTGFNSPFNVLAANTVDFASGAILRAGAFTSSYAGVGTLGNTSGPTVRALASIAVRSGTGTNPVAALEAGFFQVSNSNVSSTVVAGFGVKVTAPTATGPITTLYGVYVDKQNAAQVGTAYGLYQVDAGDRNFLAGRLDVNGGGSAALLTLDANASNSNTGSATALFSPTLSTAHTVGVFVDCSDGVNNYGTTTSAASILALNNCKHGGYSTAVPAGVKGTPSGFESNIRSDQGFADVGEPPHGFGTTITTSNGCGGRAVAAQLNIFDSAQNTQGFNNTSTRNCGAWGVASVAVTTAGAYTVAPGVVFSGGLRSGGSDAVINVTASGGAVTAVSVNAAGSGYLASAKFLAYLSGGGVNCTVAITTNASGGVTAVQLFKSTETSSSVTFAASSHGTGYSTGTANLVGRAAATAVLGGGGISEIRITCAGEGYATAPTVALSGGTGSGGVLGTVTLFQGFSYGVWLVADSSSAGPGFPCDAAIVIDKLNTGYWVTGVDMSGTQLARVRNISFAAAMGAGSVGSGNSNLIDGGTDSANLILRGAGNVSLYGNVNTGTGGNIRFVNNYTDNTAYLVVDTTGGTITTTSPSLSTSTPALNTSATWNSGSISFTHLFGNITDTASRKDSNLIDFQVASASKFRVDKQGTVFANSFVGSSFKQWWIQSAAGLPTAATTAAADPAYISKVGVGATPSLTTNSATSGVTCLSEATGQYLDHASATTSGTSKAGVEFPSAAPAVPVMQYQWNSITTFVIKTGTVITSQRLFVGWFSADPTGADSTNSIHAMGFRFSTGAADTKFQLVTGNGATMTITAPDAAIPAVAADTKYVLRIDANSGVDVKFYINNVLAGTVSTTLPGASQSLMAVCELRTLTAAARNLRFGSMRVEQE